MRPSTPCIPSGGLAGYSRRLIATTGLIPGWLNGAAAVRCAMANWVRLWEDMPNDPKWRVIAKRAGRPLAEVVAVFVHMMINAGLSANRGTLENWNDEDIAAALDIDPEAVAEIRAAMQGKTLDGDTLQGWDKRQPKRERDDPNAAERAKSWREHHKKPENATEHQRTPREDKNRIDKKLASLDAREDEDGLTPDQRATYRACLAASGWSTGDAPAAKYIGPLHALIAEGYDLEKRICPVIATKAYEFDRFGKDPPDRWQYFVPIVKDETFKTAGSVTPVDTIVVREDDENWQLLVNGGKKPAFLKSMLKPAPDGKGQYFLWPANQLPAARSA